MTATDLDPRTRILVIAALGVTQNIGYGTLYYSFSVLAPAMAHDFSWPVEWIFGALSSALLVGGFCAPKLGQLIDRHGPPRMMTAGSVIAALSLLFCAAGREPATFLVGLVVSQVISTLVQYNAAFALLVWLDARRAQRNITYLTLIAGFASTMFWPLTSALQGVLTWREIYVIFAGMHLLACLPVHAALARLRPVAPTPLHGVASIETGILPEDKRRLAFALMVIGFALTAFINAAVLIHMLPLLGAVGAGAASVLIGTVFGPAQVLSRLINMIFGAELPALTLAIIGATFLPLALVTLVLTAPGLPGALAFSVLFGLGSGLNSIIQGTLPLALFGRAGYAQLLGRISAVRLVVSAAAPFLFAFAMANFGAKAALTLSIVLGSGAVAAFACVGRQQRR